MTEEAWANLTFFLTPIGIAMAIVSGAALGVVARLLRPGIAPGSVGFVTVIAGVLWYVPIAVSRFLAPVLGQAPGADVRLVGQLVLFALFAGCAWAAESLMRRNGR